MVLDREADTARLTDLGQGGQDYDPANFDLTAAKAAAASSEETAPSRCVCAIRASAATRSVRIWTARSGRAGPW